MMNISEIRKKYPSYDDMSDQELAEALHQKHYSDMDFNEFSQKIGLDQKAESTRPATADGSLLGRKSMAERSGASFPEGMTEEEVSREIETPDILKAENIPSPRDFWEATKAVPEVADQIVTGTLAYGAGFGEQMRVTTERMLSNLNPMTKDHSVEEAVRKGKKARSDVSEKVMNILHLGQDPELSPAARQSLQLIEGADQKIAREWTAEPLGSAYGRLTGSEAAGKLTTDALEFVLEFAAFPAMFRSGKAKIEGIRRAKTRKAARETVTPERKTGEARKQEEVRAEREQEIQEAFEGTPEEAEAIEALETRERLEAETAEQRARLDDAEAIRQREYEARQKMYEDFFNEDNVVEFLDDVEGFIQRKAKGEAPTVTKEEVDILYNNFLERTKNRDPVLRKDWENWRAERIRLDAEGIKPQADLFRGLQFDIGPEGRGLPPGYSDLKFGVETQRPYPQSPKTEALVQTEGGYTPLHQKLGYKGEYSLRRKMRPTGRKKNKAPTKEEFQAASSAPTITRAEEQGTSLAEMGEQIFRDLESRGIDTSQAFSQEPYAPMVRDYTPPADAQAMETAQTKMVVREKKLNDVIDKKKQLAEREQLIRQIAGRKQRKAQADELSRLMEEQRSEIEGKNAADPETLSLDELEQLEDTYEHYTESKEPEATSPFRESLEMDAPRPLDEMMQDWNTVFADDWRSERGSISFEKLSKAQQDAINRLHKDIQVIKRNANKVGKRISQYLIDAGFTQDPNVARYIEENAGQVVKDEHTRVEISTDADPAPVTKMYERMIEANKRPEKPLKEKIQDAGSKIWAIDTKVRKALESDPSGEASAALNAKINEKGAQGWADQYFHDARNQIFGHLNGREREAVDVLVNARNKLDIAERYGGLNRKTPDGVTAEQYASFIKDFQRQWKLSDESMRRVRQASEDYFNTMRDLLETKYKEGAVPEWLYNILRDNNYAPIRYMEAAEKGNILTSSAKSMDMKRPPRDLEELNTLTDERVASRDLETKSSEIRRLAGGKDKWEKLNSEELLSAMISETANWVMRNKATRNLGRYAEKVDNPWVKPAPVKKTRVGSQGDVHKSYEAPPEGMKELHYFDNGERKTIHVQDWFAEQWTNTSPEMSAGMSTFLRTASMSGATRAFATGAMNPTFFLKGHAMDLFTIYSAAQKRLPNGKYKSVYSTFPPRYLAQIYSDMTRVAPDVVRGKGKYLEAVEDGLVQPWLTEGAQPSLRSLKGNRGSIGAARKTLEGTRNALSYLNRMSEIMARMAVRERLLREGHSREAATATSRDYLDYAQGGSWVKSMDNVVPYLNVAVQGVRTELRSAKRNPQEFAMKAAWLAGLAGTFQMMALGRDQDAVEQSSDYVKNNYLLAPTGWKLKDDFGNEHRISFKIRKEPALAPLFAAGEMAGAAAMGHEPEFKRAWKSFREPLPRVGASSIPSLAAGVAYSTNTDPYTLQRLWKGTEVPPEFEWDRQDTSQFWKDAGDMTGLSPERMKGAVQQIVGDGGMFGGLAASGYDWMRDGLPEEEHESIARKMILDNWGSDFLHVSNEMGKYWEQLDDIDKEESGKRVAQNQEMDQLAREYYIEESIEYDKINDFLSQFPREDQKRLLGRLENFMYTKDLPHRKFWMGISSMNTPEAKARAVKMRLNDAETENERRELERALIQLKQSPAGIIPESIDSQFWQSFYKQMGGEE